MTKEKGGQNLLDKVVSLCKRRGFIFPGSEIYGGLAGFWDYGPLGVELKNNIKKSWWRDMVYQRDDVVGLDAAIIMNPQVWEASGHTKSLVDPLVECKVCHKRVRADQEDKLREHEAEHPPLREATSFAEVATEAESEGKQWTDPKTFNLLTEVYLGVTEPKEKTYLRGEITQGVFVNFSNVISSSRVKVPFGIAQIGKAFRNEITPGNFTFRSREFEQMELEYFVKPDEKEAEKVFGYWKDQRLDWYKKLGIKSENLRFRKHADNELAHYARLAEDIEYNSPFGWKEFEGIHHRGDWDLSRHNLKYRDPETNEEYTPWVIETSGGVDRAALFFLLDAYYEDEDRVVLKLHPKLAPYQAAVFPLVANKPELVKKAWQIFKDLKMSGLNIAWDDRGNIGKRYYSQDEIGTPLCLTFDFDSLDDKKVTVRDRDTMKQERVEIERLAEYLKSP